MNDIQKFVKDLPLNKSEKIELLKKIGKETNPKKVAFMVDQAITKAEKDLAEEDAKLNRKLAIIDKEYEQEVKEVEERFEKTIPKYGKVDR